MVIMVNFEELSKDPRSRTCGNQVNMIMHIKRKTCYFVLIFANPSYNIPIKIV